MDFNVTKNENSIYMVSESTMHLTFTKQLFVDFLFSIKGKYYLKRLLKCSFVFELGIFIRFVFLQISTETTYNSRLSTETYKKIQQFSIKRDIKVIFKKC